MKRVGIAFIAVSLACNGVRGFIVDEEIFSYHSVDSLAPRDEYGLLHQGKATNEVDFARRYNWRWIYYFKAKEQLMVQTAYVGAMQSDLGLLGYYLCRC